MSEALSDSAPAFDSYPRPALAVDPVVLEVSGSQLRVALTRREVEPQLGSWALPGVFVNAGEVLEHAVERALLTKCGVAESLFTEQLFTWDAPGRDPRGWVVVVAYVVIAVSGTLNESRPSPGALRLFDVEVPWPDETGGSAFVRRDGEGVDLAFDHSEILGAAVKRLRGRLRYTSIALNFLPETFTLRAAQDVYEAISGETINKDSFRRHIVQTMQFVEPTGRFQDGVAHRPAELYRRTH